MAKTGPNIVFARKSGVTALFKRMAGLGKIAAYVGVPAEGTKKRSAQLLQMADATRGKKKARLLKAAMSDVTNAELLFIHTKGSPANHIPARPVLQPATEADGNRQPISRELAGMTKACLAGDREGQLKGAQRAALAGQNASRKWFTDGRNGWDPLADSTKRGRLARMSGAQRKKAETLGNAAFTPLVDTGALRASIVGVVSEE